MFPAKLLLFGEYTLMHGSMALAIPFGKYSGDWTFSDNPPENFRNMLIDFYNYLKAEESKFIFNIDLNALKEDISRGIYFNSTIPVGYGTGSSGALCAAFYSRYAVTPIPPNSSDMMLPVLQKHLSVLENYFHGASSGIDPLVSYTGSPVLLEASGLMKRMKNLVFKNLTIFLLDTGTTGDTGKNVKIFREMMQEHYFAESVKKRYIPLVNKCINKFTDGEEIFSSVAELSLQQQALFEPMIPLKFMKYFQKAEDEEDFVLKLCGSGGGGYMLGFSKDIRETTSFFKSEKLEVIVPIS